MHVGRREDIEGVGVGNGRKIHRRGGIYRYRKPSGKGRWTMSRVDFTVEEGTDKFATFGKHSGHCFLNWDVFADLTQARHQIQHRLKLCESFSILAHRFLYTYIVSICIYVKVALH